jgi:hypothetical protein
MRGVPSAMGANNSMHLICLIPTSPLSYDSLHFLSCKSVCLLTHLNFDSQYCIFCILWNGTTVSRYIYGGNIRCKSYFWRKPL